MKDKIKPIIIFILLLLGMAYFPYIPIKIAKIDINTFSQTKKVLYNLACDIGYMVIIFVLYRKEIISNFKAFFKKFGKNFEFAFKYYFIGLVIMIASNLIITFLFKQANAGNEEAVRELINKYPIYMIFSVSIYAPFVEELIFRKSIRDIFKIYNKKIWKYVYVIFSGLVFASLHILGMTKSAWDYLYIIPYLSLGITFALLYDRSDNIFSSICMHSLHNSAAVMLYILAGVV